jgi:hypothetical protein
MDISLDSVYTNSSYNYSVIQIVQVNEENTSETVCSFLMHSETSEAYELLCAYFQIFFDLPNFPSFFNGRNLSLILTPFPGISASCWEHFLMNLRYDASPSILFSFSFFHLKSETICVEFEDSLHNKWKADILLSNHICYGEEAEWNPVSRKERNEGGKSNSLHQKKIIHFFFFFLSLFLFFFSFFLFLFFSFFL